MSYTPDYWKLVKITHNDKVLYKVLGHWIGGYAAGDSWRLNSGITRVEFDATKNCYLVHGTSGSIYRCYAPGEHISGYMHSVIEGFVYKAQSDQRDVKLEFVDISEYPYETAV